MKSPFVLTMALLSLAAAPLSLAGILAYEPFDYTPGSNHLTPLNGGLGFSAAWARAEEGANDSITVYAGAPGTGSTNSAVGSPGNLDGVFNNPAVATTPSGSGNRSIDGASGDDRISALRKLSASAGSLAGADKVLWASVLWTMDGSNFGRQVGFALGTDGLKNRSTNVSTSTTWGGSGAGDAMGVGGAINTQAVTPTIWDNGNVAVRTTTGAKSLSNTFDNIVILKYVFADGATPDRVYAWAFGENETITETAFNTHAVFAESVVDQSTLDVLSFGQSQVGVESIDEIRLGDTFADVISLPPARIASFGVSGATGVINQVAKTISLTVPFGTNLATLAPTFTLSSGTCNQTSGAVPSPTFASSNPVTYTVTDGATVNNYTVTVTVTPASTACAILTCSFGAIGQAVIDEAAGTVVLTVPPSQPVTALAPTFTLSANATISPASGSTRDFTNPVSYRVTAQNGSTFKDYTVSIQSFGTWDYSGSLFINTTPAGANVTSSVSNFPLLIRFNSGNFDFAQAQSDGRDIRFTAAGASLPYQIDQWDAAGGKAAVWVRIPTIAGNSIQEIKMYWGKSGVSSLSSGSSVFNSTNGYASVIHLGDTLTDETGTTSPTNLNTTATNGLIGRARTFAAGQGVLCGSSITGLPTGSGPFSTGVWIRTAKSPSVILGWGVHAPSQKKVIINFASPPSIRVECWFGGADITGSASVPKSEWTYVVHTFQSSGTRLYVNGALDASNNGGTMQLQTTGRLDIGGWQPDGGFNFVGDIDEVRISNVVRTADWVKLEYENQKPMQTLVGGIVPAGSDFSVSPTSVTVNEGASTSLTAQAGGAQKIYWIYKKGGQETVLATDQLSFTYTAGRVSADDSAVIQFKAVFAGGTQTRDVPLTVLNTVPEPAFTLVPSTTQWDGRQTMTVTANITNLAAMQAAGFGTLNYQWAVSGVAVTKQANNGTLTLTRSQGSGPMTVTLTADNGGAPVSNSVIINVQEPASDPWVQRTPGATEKPVNGQFFARDPNTGLGTIYYNGTQTGLPASVYLKVYKTPSGGSETLDATYSQPLVGGAYAFSAPIAAGLFTYRVVYGTTTGGTDNDVATVSDLVCGDAYFIEGQSNAVALSGQPVNLATDPFVRTFGTNNQWGRAVSAGNDYRIGAWGMPLALHLKSTYNMPICIINAAVGGTRIDVHMPNPANHALPLGTGFGESSYADLFNRINGAKLSHGIRGVFWHQGESNSGADSPTGDWDYKSYQQFFTDLSAAWKQDFPNIQRYVIYQIQPKACGLGPKGDQIREVLRTLPRVFSNMSILSTIGITTALGHDGCHYSTAGYQRIADLAAPVAGRDFYGVVSAEAVTAPTLQRAYYTNSTRNRIALEFDQTTSWNSFATQHFYLDDVAANISSGSDSGNVITLQLAAASNSSTIDYVQDQKSTWDNDGGKLIYGTNTIAALTFADVAIGPAPPAGLSATGGTGQVSLTWTATTGATSYKVKRATTSGGPYTTIATTAAPSFTDLSVMGGMPYFYVVSAVNNVGTSSSEGLDSTQATATPLGGYAAWAANPAQGLTAGVNDGVLMDPDFDGIQNLLEFILGGAPMSSSHSVMPTLKNPGGQWLFEYDRNRDSLPPATTQVVQYGSDLVGWNDIIVPATTSGAVTVTPGGPFDHVAVTIPSAEPKTFVRLKASL